MKPRALILRAAGTNCDAETAHALQIAGADVTLLHIRRLLEQPDALQSYQLLAIPGGFSYGDDISAGRIYADQLMQFLHDPLHDFVRAGKPIIGVCNGFQVLIKTDLLPGPLGGLTGQTCTLTDNDNGRFIDRWIHLKNRSKRCIWTAGLDHIELPIAHGEGKLVAAHETVRKALWDNGQVVLTYVRPDGSPANGQAPDNPNGSTDDIAGICDSTGLVFGLMPHPERYVSRFQHPAWTSRPLDADEGQGLKFFRNAVNHALSIGSGL